MTANKAKTFARAAIASASAVAELTLPAEGINNNPACGAAQQHDFVLLTLGCSICLAFTAFSSWL